MYNTEGGVYIPRARITLAASEQYSSHIIKNNPVESVEGVRELSRKREDAARKNILSRSAVIYYLTPRGGSFFLLPDIKQVAERSRVEFCELHVSSQSAPSIYLSAAW